MTLSRDVLAEVFGTVLLGSASAAGFGYVLAVLTWPSIGSS
ncbi:hypothetical protein [Actinomadura chokoriensis]|uniref:Aquaporin family protein n=1 Tax=Actinomadura chokoriensis TaxID=454156 RepID=A0ABV4R584_9ACTN